MSKWREFIEATKRWRVCDLATIVAEAKIAAVAYDIAAVGLGIEIAKNDVAEKLLEENVDLVEDVWFDELGTPLEHPIPVTPISESALQYLYTADQDARDEFWLSTVTILLFDCDLGTLPQCECQAKRALKRARVQVLSKRKGRVE